MQGMVWHKYWGPTKGRPPIVLQKWALSESNMQEWPLRINHYAEQSAEHFVRVRSNRTYGITSTGRNESAVLEASCFPKIASRTRSYASSLCVVVYSRSFHHIL